MSEYYVFCDTINNKSAHDLYELYIEASDGYCNDVLQEENDDTWSIFRAIDYHDWLAHPFELRYHRCKPNERITKSYFWKAGELNKRMYSKYVPKDKQTKNKEFFSDNDESEDEDESYDSEEPEADSDIEITSDDDIDLFCSEDEDESDKENTPPRKVRKYE